MFRKKTGAREQIKKKTILFHINLNGLSDETLGLKSVHYA